MNTDQKNNNVIIIKKEPAFLPATMLEPVALRLKEIEVIGHWNNIFVKKRCTLHAENAIPQSLAGSLFFLVQLSCFFFHLHLSEYKKGKKNKKTNELNASDMGAKGEEERTFDRLERE